MSMKYDRRIRSIICAVDFGGIDLARRARRDKSLMATSTSCRIFFVDEYRD